MKITETTKAPVWVAVIVDESGSMAGSRDKVISGFNEFLQDRKKDSEDLQVRLWLTKFNTTRTVVLSGEDVNNVREMERKDYNPAGGTALFDAVGATVYAMDSELAKVEGQKPRIIVCIFTDGEENSSEEINGLTLKTIIKNRESTNNYVFKFVGASPEAMLNEQAMGMKTKARKSTGQTLNSGFKGTSNVVRAMSYAPGATLGDADNFVESNISIYNDMDTLANATVDKQGNIVVDNNGNP